MKSIRRYLTWRLVLFVLFLIVFGNTLLYIFVYHRIVLHFDMALKDKADAFAQMIEQNHEGIALEMRKEFMPEYDRESHAEYYQIWSEDGEVISRSPSLKGRDLPQRAGTFESPAFWNLDLPDGRPGRAIGVSFFPFIDNQDLPLVKNRRNVHIVLARDSIEISNMLRVLLLGTGALIVITLTGIIIIVPRVVMAGLSPLKRLADYTATIDSLSLGSRYNTEHLPDELRSITGRLNELLKRIERAFTHEKRLTADMAHELKTPIAELRSLAEVALKWPDDTEFTNNALKEACAISNQMDNTVSMLLALGRCESGKQNISPVPFDLKRMILQLLEPWHKVADAKDIRIKCDLPDTAEVITDEVMLISILTNLFSNAVEYCPEGGHVECSLKAHSENMSLSIINSNASLTEEDLPHMFEHLWRKDSARSGSSHSGLGLSLVDGFARILGIAVKAELLQSGDFCVTLLVPFVLPEMK
ncbi:sensor protein QseC [bacterium BMS3Abin09]|nr:sensor protein QseC [bacterium BMS3Abin09]GBE41880.1 sensor protein QseC [bacterium BMS3Bbin09]